MTFLHRLFDTTDILTYNFCHTNFIIKNQTKLAICSYLESLLITTELITMENITKGNYPSITKTELHNKDGLTLHNKDGRK